MRHLDEARQEALKAVNTFLRAKGKSWRILLIEDAQATFRMVLWCPNTEWEVARQDLDQQLRRAAGPFWSGSVLRGSRKKELPDGPWQQQAWEEGTTPVENVENLKLVERHRAKTGWFEAPEEQRWKLQKEEPALVLFYSFKGGVGRSTALVACALQLAAAGERVVVLDADLDAPGVSSLLCGTGGLIASWGVVDYLLERPILDEAGSLAPELEDYYHRCPPSLVPGAGDILVFPAGCFGRRYLDKLARLDYGSPREGTEHPFQLLLDQIRAELSPRWILIDSRAGLGDVAGFLAGGLCHLHVILGTFSEASWQGIELLLDRLGADRVRQGEPQAECLLVQAMVPRTQEQAFQEAVREFTSQASDAFSEHYYADEGDDFWTLDDLESADAPHVPTVLEYDERLAHFGDLEEVADVLRNEDRYRDLVARLQSAAQRLKESAT